MNPKTTPNSRVVGLDSHPDTFTAALLRGATPAEAVTEKIFHRLPMAQLATWAKKHTTTEDLIVLEASGNSFQIVRLLAKVERQALVLESGRIGKLKEAHANNDKISAVRIGKAYLAGTAKVVWVPDAKTQERRDWFHAHRKVVKHATQARNRLRSYLSDNGVRLKKGTSLAKGKAAAEQLRQLQNWTPRQWQVIEGMLLDLRHADEQRTHWRSLIAQEVLADPQLLEIVRLCGVREMVAFALGALIGDLHRFAEPKKLVKYIGLNPAFDDSGNEKWSGGIRGHGRKDLRSLLIESAQAIWNAGTGLPVGQPLLHGSWVNYAAFSPDGKMVVTACADHKARLWDVATGRRILVDLDHKDGVHSAQFSPDGRMVVTASLDGTARVWRLDSLQSGDSTLILRHSAGVVRASFSPDGHHIVTTCTDGSVRIWDLAGSVVAPVSERMVASEDGSRILTLTSNRVQVTDAVSGTVISSIFPANSLPSKIILSRNGHFGLGISDLQSNTNPPAHFLQVWDMTTGTAVAPGLFISNSLAGAVPSDDGKRLLVYGGGTVQAWDVIAQTNMSPRLMFEEPVTAAIFTPDGKQMAILSGKSLQLRDASGQLVFAPLLHSRPVVYASFSPNGSRLVTCCSDDQIHKCCATIWDTATGRVGPEFWHNDGVLFAAFDPEGKRVVTASEDYTARIWDAATGKQLTPDLQHADRVKSAVFSPDGKWVVTACGDKTVRVWSATTGDPLTPPLRHLTSLASAQFLGDGHRVIASDQEGNSWIWDLKLDSRPEGDVRKIAGLLSGEPLGVPNDSSSRRPESFESLWRELRSKYPASFLTSPGETATWDEYEAEESENEKQWFAAAFHLRQLLSVDPSSQSLGARLANAEQHLKSEN